MTGTSLQSCQDTNKSEPVQVNHHLAAPSRSLADGKSPSQQVAQLIGKKCLLKCNLNGYALTALLDSGSQVSIIDRPRKQKYLIQQEVRPVSELIGSGGLDLTAANGRQIPYDGWVELTYNLPGNDDLNLTIRVPFLVSRVNHVTPLLGFNVSQELILGQESEIKAVAIIVRLLREAMQIENDQAEAIVNFVQTQESTQSDAVVRVARQDVVVRPDCVVLIKCKVPADFTSFPTPEARAARYW